MKRLSARAMLGHVAVASADQRDRSPRSRQELDHLLGVQAILNGPRVSIEPAPDGLEHARREQVDVRVDDHPRYSSTTMHLRTRRVPRARAGGRSRPPSASLAAKVSATPAAI